MNTNSSICNINHHVDTGGFVWNRLHSEREAICETLLKETVTGCEPPSSVSNEDDQCSANWDKGPLQARLRKIDDALDRLMAGSYGHCSNCGRRIEDTKLDLDPAMAFCTNCLQRRQVQTALSDTRNCDLPLPAIDHDSLGVSLEMLAPFDTISVKTQNSDYRIFMLDPKTGRALVEGGRHFVEPEEAILGGSALIDGSVKYGWIGIGRRMEVWINGKFVSTSPVESVQVVHHTPEPVATVN